MFVNKDGDPLGPTHRSRSREHLSHPLAFQFLMFRCSKMRFLNEGNTTVSFFRNARDLERFIEVERLFTLCEINVIPVMSGREM